jgi:cytidylate kinase
MPPLDALFLVQSKIIRDISNEESCVIVGRCADFVLKDQPGCFNVFIHATNNFRNQRIINDYGMEPALVGKEMEQADHDRANYCRHFTGKEWGKATNYNFTIDSSVFGTEKAADLIVEAVQGIS